MSRESDKLRTIPLDDDTHRRLRVYVHGTGDCEDMGVALARVGSQAVNAWLDAQEAAQGRAVLVGDPSEGADDGALYGAWRR